MLRSWCIIWKTWGEAGCTWSRLFHTRKRFLSDFRPRTWSGHGTLTEGTNKRTSDKSRPRSSEAERRQHFNGEKHQDKSHNYYRNNTSDKRRDIDFSREHRTKHWRAQPNEDRNDRQMLDYRRQGQPFSDSERQMPEEINPYRPKYRNAFKDSLTFEQNQRHRSDNRSDGPHLKMKKRVLTERELREEEEFRRSSVEEVDARDRFGDYGDDTGNEMRDGQYKTDDRNANYDNRMRHEQYRTDDRVARYDNRMRHEQYQREAPRRNWSDTFGTISLEDKPSLGDVLFGKEPPPSSTADWIPAEERFEDKDDGVMKRPHIPLSRTNRKHVPNWYARRIEKLGEKGMVKEALDLFEKQMIEADRVKPTHYEFGLMISLLGRVGYVQKAFNFFYQMQKMDLIPEPKVFTSLFNACAKSSIKGYGLQRAHKLRYHMIEQSIEPTLITYQAMISAFGMCGDIEMAFSLLDEVLLKHRPNQNLLCSALVACISDKDAGFRHAILVWRKLVKKGVKPDLASYNLLLRAIKECGVGPLTKDNNLLLIETENQETGSRHGNKQGDKKIVSSLQMKVDPDNLDSVSFVEVIEGTEPSHSVNNSPHGTHKSSPKTNENLLDKETVVNDNLADADSPMAVESVKHWWEYDLGKLSGTTSDAVVRHGVRRDMSHILSLDPEMMPNILNPNDRSLQVVSLGQIETKEDRLALCGGVKGYLSSIEMEGIKPDLVTFIQLVSVANLHEEDEVLEMMSLYNVKPDIDFFNHLIVKKAYRHEDQAALDIRELIEEYGLVPNLQTYGCWAKVCGRRDGEKLFKDMADANLQPNTAILHSLVRKSGNDFLHKSWLMHQMRMLGIPADTAFINMVEKYISKVKKIIVQKERGEAVPNWSQIPNFEERFWKFMEFYKKWVSEIPFQKEEHPWAQFRDKTDKTEGETQESNVT